MRISNILFYLSSRSFTASPPDPPDHPEVLLRKQTLHEHLRLASIETCEAFKSAMRKVPQQESRTWLKRGVTCSTFSSVSYHPPIISFCLNQGSRLSELIKSTGKFAVHVLAQDQVEHGLHFSKPALESQCQFYKVPHVQGEEGLPIILGSLAVFVCDSHSYHGVGDHTVWYGNVTGVSVSETLHDPLIYFVRKFRSVGDEIFINAFETATLPFENWTHEAHLRMAWNYITEHGKEKAVPYIKLGIQKYNEKNRDKIKTGYHETITMFFIHLVSDAIVTSVNANESFEEFYHEEARNRFIDPDRKSLP
ncbi:hypothetical protein Btru_068306 [Bulinus truncatus]|nr:hypothetical protein Btru_068306 [Bulinus truncatus]